MNLFKEISNVEVAGFSAQLSEEEICALNKHLTNIGKADTELARAFRHLNELEVFEGEVLASAKVGFGAMKEALKADRDRIVLDNTKKMVEFLNRQYRLDVKASDFSGFKGTAEDFVDKYFQLSGAVDIVGEQTRELIEAFQMKTRKYFDSGVRIGKKHVILKQYIVSYMGQKYHHHEDFIKKHRILIDALVMFETGRINGSSQPIEANLFADDHQREISNETLYLNCEKIESIKTFKNGDFKIVFRNEKMKKDFVRMYALDSLVSFEEWERRA